MKALTSEERSQFIADHPGITVDSVPPWGAVIEWGAKRIVVFFDTLQQMRLTDITDRPDVLTDVPAIYNPATASMWYYLPQEIMDSIQNLPNPLAPNVLIPVAIIALAIILRKP